MYQGTEFSEFVSRDTCQVHTVSRILSREPSDVMHTQRRRVHASRGGGKGGGGGERDGEEKWGGDVAENQGRIHVAENQGQPGLPPGENKESFGGSNGGGGAGGSAGAGR
jgi:hypothetical protein